MKEQILMNKLASKSKLTMKDIMEIDEKVKDGLMRRFKDNDIFSKRKQDILNKDDKSSKGNLDKHIFNLCSKINKKKNY